LYRVRSGCHRLPGQVPGRVQKASPRPR